MKTASLRLESFGAAALRNAAAVTTEDVDQAYHDGHERGLSEGRETSLDALTAQMTQMRQALHLLDADAQRIRQETLASVAPALELIIDLLGPAGARSRLLQALGDELARLVRSDAGTALQIRCAPDLRADIQDCVDRAGLAAVLDDGDPHLCGIELAVEGGSMRFDPQRPVAELKNIIAELKTKE